jgi:dTDP-4-dehydrorhamnose 3,5-epimerase
LFRTTNRNRLKESFGVALSVRPVFTDQAGPGIVGVVYDVAVDLRKGSPTFGQWVGVELSAENKLQFYIPQGFAHGFSVLSETAIFAYKCDNLYNPQAERGILFNDPALGIDWKVAPDEAIISGKDLKPVVCRSEMNFTF